VRHRTQVVAASGDLSGQLAGDVGVDVPDAGAGVSG